MMAEQDELGRLFSLARKARPDLTTLEPGFEDRVLRRIKVRTIQTLPLSTLWERWKTAFVLAASCLILAWFFLGPGDPVLDLAGGMTSLFDLETTEFVLPGGPL